MVQMFRKNYACYISASVRIACLCIPLYASSIVSIGVGIGSLLDTHRLMALDIYISSC